MMIKTFFLVTTIFFFDTVLSQEVYLESGKVSTTFRFFNATDEKLENLYNGSNTFMAIGYRNKLIHESINAFVGLRYTGYSTKGSLDSFDSYLEWEANYLELNTGLEVKILSFGSHGYSMSYNDELAYFYLTGYFSLAHFIDGYQRFNNKVISLKGANDFDKQLLMDFRFGAGFAYPVSDNLDVYLQYVHGSTLPLKNDKTLEIISNSIGFGIKFKTTN
jgi:hypothetical protein